jgi:hypothetical protein
MRKASYRTANTVPLDDDLVWRVVGVETAEPLIGYVCHALLINNTSRNIQITRSPRPPTLLVIFESHTAYALLCREVGMDTRRCGQETLYSREKMEHARSLVEHFL